MNNEECPQGMPVRDEIAPAAHRLRNRLVTITATAAQLAGSEDLSAKKAGERIQKESSALTEELDQLITLSRVNEGYLPVTPEPLPVIDLIEDTMDRYSMAGTERGITITLDEDAPDIYILGTEDLVDDILDNLLSNAVRYCRKQIRISVQNEDEIVTVQVADDGPGIREDDLPHLFERFYIGKDGHFGLGLPIAHDAAKRLGGTLTAANRPEGGAVFTVEFKKA